MEEAHSKSDGGAACQESEQDLLLYGLSTSVLEWLQTGVAFPNSDAGKPYRTARQQSRAWARRESWLRQKVAGNRTSFKRESPTLRLT